MAAATVIAGPPACADAANRCGRASRAKLTMLSLRRLREELFRLQLQSIQDMIVGGVDVSKLAEPSHCATATAAIDTLQGTAPERQRP